LALCGRRHRSVLTPGGRLVDERRDDGQVVTDALVIAIWRRGQPDPLLPHSDRGSQSTSQPFQKLMAGHGIVCSMSRSGNVWDTAAMERFFCSLQTERTAHQLSVTRRSQGRWFDNIECFYNPKRRPSTIGDLSPMQFEMQWDLLRRVSTEPGAGHED
jgi:putative transposase